MSETSNVSSTFSSKIGRPLGTTTALKEVKKQQLIDGKNEIAAKYFDLKNDAKKNKNGQVEKSSLKKIIEEVTKKEELKKLSHL